MKELSLSIDWSELDLFGHVNNVAYFRYVQAARINYCESIGLTSLNDKEKLSFIVAATQCTFKKPLYFPGQIKVISNIVSIQNTSFQMEHSIYDQKNELTAIAVDVLLVYDYKNRSKTNMPPEMRKEIETIEKKTFL